MNHTNYLLIIAVIALAVSSVQLGVIYNEVSKITGRVEENAVVNFTINTGANIEFNVSSIEFGEGHVDEDAEYAILESNNTEAIDGTWSYTSEGLILENRGNVNLSITLQGTNEDFMSQLALGGNYKWMVRNTTEAGSCADYAVTEGTWFDADSDAQVEICNDFLYNNETNQLRIDVYLKISEGLTPGIYSDTIIARATAL